MLKVEVVSEDLGIVPHTEATKQEEEGRAWGEEKEKQVQLPRRETPQVTREDKLCPTTQSSCNRNC